MNPETLAALLANLTSDGLLAVDVDRLARTPAAPAQERGGAVAVIPLMGVLRPRGGETWFGSFKGMDTTRAALEQAGRNPDVASIVLRIDSPGGTVAGTIETAATVARIAQIKPIIAIADGLASSAAYWIGSQASEFVAAPSAEVGSIGVISLHQSAAKAYERMGVETTITRAGKFKGEGNPYEPLTDDAKANQQARVDAAYDQFIAAVASGRKVSEKRVRDGFGEGRTLGAGPALAEGMVDRIATLEEVISGLSAGKGRVWRRRSALAFA